MTLSIVLICCLPAGLILLVFLAIGAAAARTYRTGRRALSDFKPYVDDLSKQASRAQHLASGFAGRTEGVARTFEEIGGRWAFITKTISETANSPAVRFADLAGRFANRR